MQASNALSAAARSPDQRKRRLQSAQSHPVLPTQHATHSSVRALQAAARAVLHARCNFAAVHVAIAAEVPRITARARHASLARGAACTQGDANPPTQSAWRRAGRVRSGAALPCMPCSSCVATHSSPSLLRQHPSPHCEQGAKGAASCAGQAGQACRHTCEAWGRTFNRGHRVGCA